MWSECRCDSTTKSSVLRSTPFAFTLAAKMSASLPVSNKIRFSGDLHERGKTPVLRHRRVGSECVVKDGDLTFGLGRSGSGRNDYRDEVQNSYRDEKWRAKL